MWVASLFFAALLCLLSHISADARPQVLVIIADHLTLADTLRPQYPAFARLRAHGQIALLSPGLAHGPRPVLNVYATLGAGDAITFGDKSQGLLARTLAKNSVRTALVGSADSDETGAYAPASVILPSSALSFAGNDGTTPDPLAPGGRRIDPTQFWQATQSALASAALVLAYDGDFARLSRSQLTLLPIVSALDRTRALNALDLFLAPALSYADTHSQCNILFVVPTGPLRSNKWDSLTPFYSYAALVPRSPVLQSDTTQTWGLVAARDFAPTVLGLLSIPPPVQMTGARIETAPTSVSDTQTRLRRLDTLTRLNQQAQNPVFWTAGFIGAFVVLSGLGLAFGSAHKKAAYPWARYGLRVMTSLSLALLLAPLLPAHTLPAYCLGIGVSVLLLGLLPSPAVLLGMTLMILMGDALTGTVLSSQSLLSAYALSGIRFYGIGNEYMGVMLAGTLVLAGSAWFAKCPRWTMALLFIVVIVVLSFPSFGAKAGGAITAAATFYVAWRALENKSVGMRHCVMGITAGFALILLWGVLGHWLPLRQTHIGSATAALGHARFGYISGVALRKVGLAVHVLLHPGTLAGLIGLALAALLAHRIPAERMVLLHQYLPRFHALWRAGLWGGLVCVLFNDSGIVAAILLLTSLALVGLHSLLAAQGNVEPKSVSANTKCD